MQTNVHFRSYMAQLFLELKMFQTKFVENSKHILCSIKFFFFENHAVYGKTWKSILERGRPQMTIWRMRIACWIPKATDTHSACVILIAFPLQQWQHAGASMFRYMYSACLVETALEILNFYGTRRVITILTNASHYVLT